MPHAQQKLSSKNNQNKKFIFFDKVFCSNLSHNMRTPLTLIKGFTELLLTSENLSDSQIESLKIILDNEYKLEKLAIEIERIMLSGSGKK